MVRIWSYLTIVDNLTTLGCTHKCKKCTLRNNMGDHFEIKYGRQKFRWVLILKCSRYYLLLIHQKWCFYHNLNDSSNIWSLTAILSGQIA